MKTPRRTTISDCVTDMVEELQDEIPRPLPEIAPFAGRLARHLGLTQIVELEGGVTPCGLGEEGLALGTIEDDLDKALVLCCGLLEGAEDPKQILDQLAEVLKTAPAAIVTADVRGLAESDSARWTVNELESMLREAGLPVRHVALTLTDSHGYNRDTALFALGEESLEPLLETGTWNLHFYRPPAGTVREDRKPRICVATNEIFGPALCGGIGTAYTSLVESLARAGHEVTVLFNNFVELEDEAHWAAYYGERGIRFVALDIDPMHLVIPWQHEWMRRAHKTYRWLRAEAENDRPWDCIHFPECNGLGYYTIAAKRQGLGFSGTVMCVGTHGSTRWANGSNGMAFESLLHLAEDHMERRCVEWADVLLGPSRYLLKWMDDRGWALPEQTFQQQYIQPQSARAQEERAGIPAPEPVTGFREIVFFGRLETRKGLVNFCDALDLPELGGRLVMDGLKVTFLGRAGDVDGIKADEYLKRRGSIWGFTWEQISDKNQKEAVAYLQGEGRLILVPSTVDNSPNTVYECLGLGVPLITARSGGIPELIDPHDVAKATFFHEEEAFRDRPLAETILRALDEGLVPARPAVAQVPNEQLQLDWHASLAIDHAKVAVSRGKEGSVSVLLCAIGESRFLEQALDSLKAQEFQDFEVVIALDEAFPERAEAIEAYGAAAGWGSFRTDMQRPGLVKNELAERAANEQLVFMEPDAVAFPEQLETLRSVQASTESPIVISYLHLADSSAEIGPETELPIQTFFPLGGNPAVQLYFSHPGAQTFLVQRGVFRDLGGFAADHRIDVDDCEFLARAMLAGHEVECVPEELYWSRQPEPFPPGGTSDYRSSRRLLRPYLESLPENLRWLVSHSRALDQLHEKRMLEYWDYKWKATEGFDKKTIEFDDYYEWAQGEMERIKAHWSEQVDTQKDKAAAAKSELKEARSRIKQLEKQLREGPRKKGWLK